MSVGGEGAFTLVERVNSSPATPVAHCNDKSRRVGREGLVNYLHFWLYNGIVEHGGLVEHGL